MACVVEGGAESVDQLFLHCEIAWSLELRLFKEAVFVELSHPSELLYFVNN